MMSLDLAQVPDVRHEELYAAVNGGDVRAAAGIVRREFYCDFLYRNRQALESDGNWADGLITFWVRHNPKEGTDSRWAEMLLSTDPEKLLAAGSWR
jgi:hypothetical protein